MNDFRDIKIGQFWKSKDTGKIYRVMNIEGATEKTNKVKLRAAKNYHQFWVMGVNIVNTYERLNFNEQNRHTNKGQGR